MPKTRMSVVDCTRMAAEVNSTLAGSWVQNIYTTEEDSKTFLFKLTGRGDKYLLLLESGVRFHPTEFVREKSEMPTGFAMKLRKHVRGRRLEYCRQVGLDRVVDFAFGKGTQHHHVVLEMYAGGNVILTDETGLILTLLRPYTLEEGESIRVAVGKKYPFDLALEGPRSLIAKGLVITSQDIEDFFSPLLESIEKEEEQEDGEEEEDDDNNNNDNAQEKEEEEEEKKKATLKPKKGPSTVKMDKIAPNPSQTKKKKNKNNNEKKKKNSEIDHRRELSQCLCSKGSPVQSFGPQLIDHCLVKSGFNPTEKVMNMDYIKLNSEKLSQALLEANKVMALLSDESVGLPGYILKSPQNESFYEGFEPILWSTINNNSNLPIKEYPTFYQAADEYYSKLESQKIEKSRIASEKAQISKIENVKRQQTERVEQLKFAVEERNLAAKTLERNVVLVDDSINAVNSLIASGMSWDDVDRVVKEEKRNNNKVASIISGLKLQENKITVVLPLVEEEEEEEVKDLKKPKTILIDVNIGLSAQANVGLMFADKKKAKQKAEITIERSALAVEEMKLKLNLEKKTKKNQSQVRAIRKPFWFEKFHWFLTSEGILVLGGKDAHQNELLFKRFLRKGDAYMHADMHGAPTCIVRNPFKNASSAAVIPLESMRQAGLFCVCKSSAWSAKLITSAWWVESYQVSRTAPSGEFLPTGSFMIRGKKNFLQPTRLEMGFGYIFKIDLTAKEEEEQHQEEEEEGEDNKQEQQEGEEGVSSQSKEWKYLRGKISPPAPPPEQNNPDDEQQINQEQSSNLISLIDGGGRVITAENDSKKRNPPKSKQQVQLPPPPSSSSSSSTNAVNKNNDEDETSKKKSISKKKMLKMKRAALKYADQDEEERRMAMLAIGHALPEPNLKSSEKQLVNKDGVEEEEEEQEQEEGNATSWLKKNALKKPPAQELSTPFLPLNIKQQQESSKPQKLQDEDDEEEVLVEETAIEEEEEEEEDNKEDDENVLFKGFTAMPKPTDIILYALPFCGPIDSMSHFKFRVKLTPGTLKKGKAAKQAVGLFQAKCTDRERAVINAVSDPENVAVMMMDVKVSAPGIEKLRATIKNQQQKKKKELNKTSTDVVLQGNE